MAKYKVGDIFINHNDGKILQVCEGGCEDCVYRICVSTCSYRSDICGKDIDSNAYFKELPSLPPGTKVKMRKDLTEGIEYGQYYFVEGMNCGEVTIKHYNATYKTYSIIGNTYKYTLEMFDQVINNLKENNNMETKEIKIKVPEGYEIDRENSTLECIKFKPIKKLTYKDVTEELFFEGLFAIDFNGEIRHASSSSNSQCDRNNATNKKQLERLLALNQLLNIAEYYNKKSPKEGNKVYCINFEERNKTTEYFVGEYTRPMIARGLIPMFNRHADVSAVIYNPNFKAILDLVYKGDED
jgi:hypothetical protein